MKNQGCYNHANWHQVWANAQATRTVTRPSANIFESETAYTIELAAPSFSKEDFKIAIDSKRNLTISVEKVTSEDAAQKTQQKLNHVEFVYDSFKRSFILPANADEKQVSAKYENGILTVTIPKSTQTKASFEVPVA